MTNDIAMEQQNVRRKKPPSLKSEIFSLFLKIFLIIVGFALLFTFVFGIVRVKDSSMTQAIKSRDIVVYYRLNRNYVAQDVVAVEYEGELQLRRIVAMSGDTVNISADGLEVNGSPQYEPSISGKTLPYVKGAKFPITLQANQVFVLADNRDGSSDSRVYGAVNISDIKGKVMSLFRIINI